MAEMNLHQFMTSRAVYPYRLMNGMWQMGFYDDNHMNYARYNPPRNEEQLHSVLSNWKEHEQKLARLIARREREKEWERRFG